MYICIFFFIKNYAISLLTEGGTVDIHMGTYSVNRAEFYYQTYAITTSDSSLVIIVPQYNQNSYKWLDIYQANVTLSHLIIQHTFNYSSWSGDLSSSSPLVVVGGASTLIISYVTFIPGSEGGVYVNPLILGMNDGGMVEIQNSSVVNISLSRVSLIHDYAATPFIFTNVTFLFAQIYFLFPISFIIDYYYFL
jgi:hypothetical protein